MANARAKNEASIVYNKGPSFCQGGPNAQPLYQTLSAIFAKVKRIGGAGR